MTDSSVNSNLINVNISIIEKLSQRVQARSRAPSESPSPGPIVEIFPGFTPLAAQRGGGWLDNREREVSGEWLSLPKGPLQGVRGETGRAAKRVSVKVDLKKLHSTRYCCNTQVCEYFISL